MIDNFNDIASIISDAKILIGHLNLMTLPERVFFYVDHKGSLRYMPETLKAKIQNLIIYQFIY